MYLPRSDSMRKMSISRITLSDCHTFPKILTVMKHMATIVKAQSMARKRLLR